MFFTMPILLWLLAHTSIPELSMYTVCMCVCMWVLLWFLLLGMYTLVRWASYPRVLHCNTFTTQQLISSPSYTQPFHRHFHYFYHSLYHYNISLFIPVKLSIARYSYRSKQNKIIDIIMHIYVLGTFLKLYVLVCYEYLEFRIKI